MTLEQVFVLIPISVGTIFMVLSGVGLVRMPDVFMRMSTTTKASTLGVGLILIGAMIHFHNEAGIQGRLFATIIFLVLTSPIGAHMIARAAYTDGAKLWDKTSVDELAEHQNRNT